MDDGYVIPGLNESWTLGGAKLMEWCAGFMMFIICAELLFENYGRAMPQLMLIWVGTTFTLAAIRRKFPDEERGVRNLALSSVGIEPPGIPAPALLQPYWSGAPMRAIKESSEYLSLNLDELFPEEEE